MLIKSGKALDFIQKIVVSGLPKGHTDKYCKVNAERKEKESYFELEILLNEKYYSYHISGYLYVDEK